MSDTAKVTKLREAELALEDKLSAAKAELAAARQAEGKALLAAVISDPTTDHADGQAAAHSERVATLVAAVAEARTERSRAIIAAWHAEAKSLRANATKARNNATMIEGKASALLGQLQKLQGCAYSPAWSLRTETERDGFTDRQLLPLIINGVGYAEFAAKYHVSIVRVQDRAEEIIAGLKGEAPSPVIVATPASDALRTKAAEWDQQADELEQRPVPANGTITASSRDELITAIRASDAWTLTPALSAVTSWLDEHEGIIQPQLAAMTANERQGLTLIYTLAWHDGMINRRASGIRFERGDWTKGSFESAEEGRRITTLRVA